MRMAICVILAATAAPVSAHHDGAGFDKSRQIQIEGAVTKVEWFNPHAFIHVEVKNADGSVTPWTVEIASARGLTRLGVTRESLQAETRLVVTGYRDGGGRNIASAVTLRLKDGREVAMPIFRAHGSDILSRRTIAGHE
ncbi:MAG TPA: DUF6152 family protein [Gemmatimonadales bacterium]|nr:DUF6152 family protein [Gemmatimonadales bacterium]